MMRPVIAWFAGNRVAANVIMIIVVAGGLISLSAIKRELVPSITLDVVEIEIAYPGADPVTIEQAICLPVEEAVDGLDNIKSIDALATTGACTVYITAARNDGTERLRSEIENRVDAITSFPEDVDRPAIRTVVFNERVVSVVISGRADELTLTRIGERMRDDIAGLPGITLAELGGTRDAELLVEISNRSLRRYGLTLDDVAEAIRKASLDLPAGVIKSDGGDLRLRSRGQAFTAAEFAEIAVVGHTDGSLLRIGDIATVKNGFADGELIARFDGEPAVFVDVSMSDGQDMIEITRQVRDYVDAQQALLPDHVHVTSWADDSVYLQGRIDTLVRNALGGLVLVFVLLLLVLDIELAFWTAIGTAVAFLGALFLMPYQGITLNMLSMFAFILVLGIVVDDAIIVSESIFSRAETDRGGLKGAIDGTCLVAKPVIVSVLTTMIAFAPMLFFSGPIGNEIKPLPILIITILAFSLFECMFILPAHLSRLRPPAGDANPVQRNVGRGLVCFVRRIYRPLLRRALAARYSVVALFAAGSVLTWSVVDGGWIPMRFEPEVPSDWIEATVVLPPGTPFERVERVVQRMEQAAIDLRAALEATREPGEPAPIDHIGALVAENEIQMFIELAPSETRDRPVAEIERQWRARIGEIPEAEKVEISATLSGSGRELSIDLSAGSGDTLEAVTAALENKLDGYDGVYDISASSRKRRQEVEIVLKPEARLLGVSLADLAGQVRRGYFGEEVQRIPRADGGVEVVLRHPEQERRSLVSLQDLLVRTGEGVDIPFHAVADLRHRQGAAEITRKDRRRSATIEANVDPARASADQILDELDDTGFWTDLSRRYPDLKVSADEEQDMFLSELMRNGAVALLVIYALLAMAFRSYLQPAVIVTAIPFGFIGAALGHALLGLDLTLYSLLGMIAASGVVINDNLVLIDAINRGRARGLSVLEAIDDAATTRFRPILLTSVTTFIGLLPMMLERSMQAQFLIPIAVSLAFGVLLATALTLLVVPAIYVVLEDVKTLAAGALRTRWSRKSAAPGG